jgi:serine/threonine-protein kinase
MAAHGRYTILGKLADGGMAEIFLAIQHGAEGFEKPIVLKRILTAYSADPQFRNMMLDEAHISMSLQHSNIAQVLDLGVAGGRYFLALELVDGWDLERILQRAYAAGIVWPNALSLYVIACVCRALAYAHVKSRDGKPLGIVHRDISPNNVLISDQAEVKLTDFGVAKAQRKREQTAAGVIKGKVAYMSPEQALGTTVDKRSDIFSVGSMFYRMVTEKLPFDAGDDMEQLLRVQRAEFTPPEQVKPTVGPGVAGIIMRALRLAPSERYQSADEMLVDVERVLRNEFHSAGQTELKLWLEQLARRDNAPMISKQRLDAAGVVQDKMGTDLSVGTSFELDDVDKEKGTAPTEFAMHSNPDLSARPLGGSTAQVGGGARRPASRRRSGFWLGVMFTLAALVGAKYALDWYDQRGATALGTLGLKSDGGNRRPGAETEARPPTAGTPPTPAPAPAATPAPAPTPVAAAADAAAHPAPTPEAAPTAPPPPHPAVAAGGPDGRAEIADNHATEEKPGNTSAPPSTADKDKDKDKDQTKDQTKDDDDEPDEEALLRDAVPNAENAVIGEDDAEPTAATKGQKKTPPIVKGKTPPPKPAPGPTARLAPAPARVQTALLRITSAPEGAIVRTKYKVLGRTPINLHFKTGNTYELKLVKSGYTPATRKVAVNNTKDRKLAVALKKRAAPKKKRTSFFHPHR